MDTNPVEKKTKSSSKQSPYAQIRVKKETRKKVLQDLTRINKKDFGRNIRADEYIALAISRITPGDITALQESSLSNADRLAKDYREHVAKHGPITKDEYLGKRLSGNIAAVNAEEVKNG
jgi:hypothetical protein